MVAFVTTAVQALLLTTFIGQPFENVRVMALSLLIGGVVMWLVDWRRAGLGVIISREQLSLPEEPLVPAFG
jgi:undecaprenyl pyrophosphate phosphatase UppP